MQTVGICVGSTICQLWIRKVKSIDRCICGGDVPGSRKKISKTDICKLRRWTAWIPVGVRWSSRCGRCETTGSRAFRSRIRILWQRISLESFEWIWALVWAEDEQLKYKVGFQGYTTRSERWAVYDFDWNIWWKRKYDGSVSGIKFLRPRRCLRNGLSRSSDSWRSSSSRKIRSSAGQINYVLQERVTRNVSRDTTSWVLRWDDWLESKSMVWDVSRCWDTNNISILKEIWCRLQRLRNRMSHKRTSRRWFQTDCDVGCKYRDIEIVRHALDVGTDSPSNTSSRWCCGARSVKYLGKLKSQTQTRRLVIRGAELRGDTCECSSFEMWFYCGIHRGCNDTWWCCILSVQAKLWAWFLGRYVYGSPFDNEIFQFVSTEYFHTSDFTKYERAVSSMQNNPLVSSKSATMSHHPQLLLLIQHSDEFAVSILSRSMFQNDAPFANMKLVRCGVCQNGWVPEILLATIEPPTIFRCSAADIWSRLSLSSVA